MFLYVNKFFISCWKYHFFSLIKNTRKQQYKFVILVGIEEIKKRLNRLRLYQKIKVKTKVNHDIIIPIEENNREKSVKITWSLKQRDEARIKQT